MHYLARIFSLLLTGLLTASAQESAALKEAPVKIACLGDSITFGIGLTNAATASYPAKLGELLGERFAVKGFARPGATILRKADVPFAAQEELKSAKDYKPDIVFVLLGTNDSKGANWRNQKDFEEDLKFLLDEINSISSHPRLIICLPPPLFTGKFGLSEVLLQKGIRPRIKAVASERMLQVVDLSEALSGKGAMFPDGIHPDAQGSELIAKTLFKALNSL